MNVIHWLIKPLLADYNEQIVLLCSIGLSLLNNYIFSLFEIFRKILWSLQLCWDLQFKSTTMLCVSCMLKLQTTFSWKTVDLSWVNSLKMYDF